MRAMTDVYLDRVVAVAAMLLTGGNVCGSGRKEASYPLQSVDTDTLSQLLLQMVKETCDTLTQSAPIHGK